MHCRSCLSKSQKQYFSLLATFPEFGRKSVLDILNFVLSSEIVCSESLPSEICLSCFKQLKNAYSFIILFNNSQAFLQKNSQYFFDIEKVGNPRVQDSVDVKPKEVKQDLDLVWDSDSVETILIVSDNGSTHENMAPEIFGGEETKNKKENIQIQAKKIESTKSSNIRNNRKIILVPADDVLKYRVFPKFKTLPKKSQDSINISQEQQDEVVFNEEEEVHFNEEDEIFLEKEEDAAFFIENKKIEETSRNIGANSNEGDDILVYQDKRTEIHFIEDNDKDEDLKQDILKMEENRKRNINNIQIMTIEDVINDTRKKGVDRNKRVLSVEDVIRSQSRRPKSKIDKTNSVEEFKCDICDNTFKKRRNLRLHKLYIHNPNWREKFKCSICGLQCKTVSAYRHHMLKHEGKRHPCNLCEKTYLTKSKLKEHVLRVHEKKLENKYLCTKCGKGFKFHNAFTYHMNKHSNSRNFICRYCGFACLILSALKRHERVHTGERPYKCKYCKKTFAGAAEKQKHQFGHEGVFRFGCKFCNKRFIQIYNMKVHWLQHRGPYCCEICRRSFAAAEILKFHYAHTHKIKDVIIEDEEEKSDEQNK